MSTANSVLKGKDTFIQHVSLKNYKSIKDVEIDFKPGLNIIIGKNASGKTNFINGVNAILSFNYDEIWDAESMIQAYFKYDKIEIQALIKDRTSDDFLKRERYHFLANHIVSLKINDKPQEINTTDLYAAQEYLLNMNWFFNKVFIKYGVNYREDTPFIYNAFSFVVINNDKISSELMSIGNKNDSHFLNNLFHRLHITLLELYHGIDVNKVASQSLKATINSFFERQFKFINDVVFNYSPITEIRLNPDFNIVEEDKKQKKTINNFYLEFKIDGNWLPFNLLSDGTKRLFYIISEMLSTYDTERIENDDMNIILLEEPELGIHPHQLHQLMQFIKDQSVEKQIIITTHSPQVLDVLGPNELDRVIICHNDGSQGTQLTHLSEKEIKKAKKYMQEEAFLSDYWRFSDLEPVS